MYIIFAEIVHFNVHFFCVEKEECNSSPVIQICAFLLTILLLASVREVETNVLQFGMQVFLLHNSLRICMIMFNSGVIIQTRVGKFFER